jgi:ankyrin repeat protein
MSTQFDIDFGKKMRAAIRADDVRHVVTLLSEQLHLLNANADTPFGTFLHIAAEAGSLNVVRKLLEMGSDINMRGGALESGPLTLAVSSGHIEVVKYLLEEGAKFDLSEPYRNPLFSAIYNDRLEIVKLLIEHGIDYSIKYYGDVMKGTDALAHAKNLSKAEIVVYLKSLA